MLRTSPRRVLVLALVAALALVLAAGCGGSGSSSDNPPKPGTQLTLQQYFDQLKWVRDQYEKRADLTTPSTRSLANADEAAKMYEELIGSSTQVLSELLDAMRSMKPPPDVRPAHEALLQAGPVYLQSLRDYAAWLANASASSHPPRDAKGEAALSAITDACNELLRVASGNGIYAPYIECGGEAGIGFGSGCSSQAAASAPCTRSPARVPGRGR